MMKSTIVNNIFHHVMLVSIYTLLYVRTVFVVQPKNHIFTCNWFLFPIKFENPKLLANGEIRKLGVKGFSVKTSHILHSTLAFYLKSKRLSFLYENHSQRQGKSRLHFHAHSTIFLKPTNYNNSLALICSKVLFFAKYIYIYIYVI